MTTLYPRRVPVKWRPRRPESVKRADAHVLLDRAKAGHDISAEEIAEALRLTGDNEQTEPA